MNAIHDYALLFAIAVPLVAVIGLNIFLYVGGERGAGLFPSSRPFPVEDLDATQPAPAYTVTSEVTTSGATAANDEVERRVA